MSKSTSFLLKLNLHCNLPNLKHAFFWRVNVTVGEKGYFYLFSRTITLSLQNIYKHKLHIDQKYWIKYFQIIHQRMHTSFKIKYIVHTYFFLFFSSSSFLYLFLNFYHLYLRHIFDNFLLFALSICSKTLTTCTNFHNFTL